MQIYTFCSQEFCSQESGGMGAQGALLRAKQTEHNNSESDMHFAKIFIVGH